MCFKTRVNKHYTEGAPRRTHACTQLHFTEEPQFEEKVDAKALWGHSEKKNMFVILACAAAATALQQPWLDASLPIPKRVELLMNEMTLTERARQTYAVRITTYLSQG